ncbi:MAG: alpha/beta fold hydrolase [Gemmataceae bacterium]
MFARRGFVAVLVLAVLPLACPAQEKAEPKPLERAARLLVERLDKGEFAKATEKFDAVMLKAIPAEELKKTWEEVIAEAGAFKKQLGARAETKDKYQIIYVTCAFAKATLDVRVVFDGEAKITGLQIRPAAKPAPTGVEEIYEGKLKAGATEVRLVFHLFKQKDGSYAGAMDSPDQGVKGLVLDEATVKEDAVRLELSVAKIVFEGKRSKDGQEIAGTFNQAGLSIPFTLKRVPKATEASRPQTPKKPYPYDEIEVAYENKLHGVKLAGSLTVPRSKGPFPAVLLITGSGAQDRDETILGHKPFLVLADHLTRRGIAVLRVDDRGVGGSTGSVPKSTTADFAEDVLAGVEFLKGRKEIDPARIGLLGHSEGGAIAPLVASRSKDVAFIVLLAGTGVPGHEILCTQSAAGLKLAGRARPEELALLKTLQDRLFAVVRAEKDLAEAEKKAGAALKEITGKLSAEEKKESAAALVVIESHKQLVLSPWGRYFMDYDPRPALRKVTCPVLALNGAKDVQVDAKVNLAAIEAALKEGGAKDVTIVELPDLNHLFQTCKTGAGAEYGAIEETLAPVLLERVAEWITKRTGRARP